MDLAALLPEELRRGVNVICRTPPRSGFVACGFLHHGVARRAPRAVERNRDGLYGLSLAIAGSAVYIDRHGDRHPLRPGSIFQFSDPPGGPRGRVESRAGFLECTVSFEAVIGRKLEELGLWKSDFVCAAAEPSPTLLRRYQDLYRRMVASPVTHEEALRGIVAIVDHAYAHAADIGDEARLMAEASRLLRDRVDRPHAVHQAARDLGMPYETFRKRFTAHAGMAPHAFVLRHRMERACELLRDASVKEVAAKLGYRTPFAFSRQFKKVIGSAPKQFKR
jgi:AraC-like DNA-binding protein